MKGITGLREERNMVKTIKVPVLLAILVILPIGSNVWADQNRHDEGRSHHSHGAYFHANPDLTLVSGMDSIDSKVLVDPAPNPDPVIEVIDQPTPEPVASASSQIINADDNGNWVVNVPNNAGGYTPIRIQRFGNGYMGPQGEFYYPFPHVTQLKAMYRL